MKQTDAMRRLVRKVSRRDSDKGYTLVEVLVALAIMTLLLGLVAGFLIMQMRSSAESTSRTRQQTDAVTALDRISKEVSVSDPLVKASPSELITKTTLDGGCTLTRYIYAAATNPASEVANETGTLYQQTLRTDVAATEPDYIAPAVCDAPLGATWIQPGAGDPNKLLRVVTDKVVLLESKPVFTYFDREGNPLSIPDTGWTFDGALGSNTGTIARVDIVMGAESRGSQGGEAGNIALGTSVALRGAAAGQAPGTPGAGNVNPQGLTCAAVRTLNNTMYFGSVAGAATYEITYTDASNNNQRDVVRAAPVGREANPPAGYLDTVTSGREYTRAISSGLTYKVTPRDVTGNGPVDCPTIQVTDRPGIPQVGVDVGPLQGTPIPAAPGRVVPWNNDRPTIYVTWPNLPNATGYNVYIDGELVKQIPETNNTTVNYTVPNADWSRNYNVCVAAFSNTGGLGLQDCRTVLTYPDTVVNAQSSTEVSGRNLVTWAPPVRDVDRPKEDTVAPTAYQIWRSPLDTKSSGTKTGDATRRSTLVATVDGTVTRWTDPQAELGSRYQYTVVTINATGNSWDALAAATGAGAWEGLTLQYPAAPANVAARPSGYNTNTVSWPAVKTATSYSVYRSDMDTNSGFSYLTEVSGTAAPGDRLSFIDNTKTKLGLGAAITRSTNDYAELDSRYYYYVVAHNDSGSSTGSNQANALQYPAAPPTTAAATTYGQNTITWTRGKTATSYEVWRLPEASATPGVSYGYGTKIYSGSALSFVDSVALGTQYQYYTVAINPTGMSYTSVARATTPVGSSGTQLVLQYPPDPTVTGARNSSDGTNTINFNTNNNYSSKGVTTYTSNWRFAPSNVTPYVGVQNVSIGSAASGSMNHGGRGLGTSLEYMVQAKNARGVSQNGADMNAVRAAMAASGSDIATQRPNPPTGSINCAQFSEQVWIGSHQVITGYQIINKVRVPIYGTVNDYRTDYYCNVTVTVSQPSQDGQKNEANAQFCSSNPNSCYVTVNNNAFGGRYNWGTTSKTFNRVPRSTFNANSTMSCTATNAGGTSNACNTAAAQPVPTTNLVFQARAVQWRLGYVNWRQPELFAGRVSPQWTRAADAARYVVNRQVIQQPGGCNGQGTFSATFNQGIYDDGGTFPQLCADAMYRDTITAQASNGQSSVQTYTFISGPNTPGWITAQPQYRGGSGQNKTVRFNYNIVGQPDMGGNTGTYYIYNDEALVRTGTGTFNFTTPESSSNTLGGRYLYISNFRDNWGGANYWPVQSALTERGFNNTAETRAAFAVQGSAGDWVTVNDESVTVRCGKDYSPFSGKAYTNGCYDPAKPYYTNPARPGTVGVFQPWTGLPVF